MICGTMVFEDQAIQWTLHDNREVSYTVSGRYSGKADTKVCSWEGFAAAMALAIGGDEIAGADVLYPLAEAAMPSDRALRWIP